MVKAKGKVRREKLAEEEQAIEEFDKSIAEPIVTRQKQERQTISSMELVNVMSDTFARLLVEFDPRMGDRERNLYADDRARQMLRLIKHGIPEAGGHGARITEEEQEAPLCRNCK